MRKPGGYAIWVNVSSPTMPAQIERDTFTCQHCNKLVLVKPGEDPQKIGGFCFNCSGLICPGCAALRECTPLEKALDQMEAAARRPREI